jgi:4'-phosphopantetheinyl transferase
MTSSDATWPLERDEVHLWWTRGADGDLAREGRAWLSDEERARCERFRREEDARIFAGARVFLRGTLAGYVGSDPAELVLEETRLGKPRLRLPASDVRFNLSHSGEWILLAVACGREVGADVERVAGTEDLSLLAERVLSREERRAFAALERWERQGPFFRAWTRKEAVLKALGEGLVRDPASFAVGLDPRDTGELWAPAGDRACAGIRGCDVDAPEGYAAAVAAEGGGWHAVLAVAVSGGAVSGPGG